MKNQIMEYDRSVGMDRKYGAVRIQTIKNTPVTVSIDIYQQVHLYFFKTILILIFVVF